MIMVCGEALMDIFNRGDTPSGMTLDARVGGSPFNVAVGLARMAQPVCFFASLSRDFLGERLMRALRDEGVETATLTRVDAPTTLGLIGTDAQGVPSYAFYGDGGADRQVGVDALERLPAGVAAVHLGSFSSVVEPVATTKRRVMSVNSALGPVWAVGISGSSDMPQIGQFPGPLCRICGCIGQV